MIHTEEINPLQWLLDTIIFSFAPFHIESKRRYDRKTGKTDLTLISVSTSHLQLLVMQIYLAYKTVITTLAKLLQNPKLKEAVKKNT